jgi:hypothetical protein
MNFHAPPDSSIRITRHDIRRRVSNPSGATLEDRQESNDSPVFADRTTQLAHIANRRSSDRVRDSPNRRRRTAISASAALSHRSTKSESTAHETTITARQSMASFDRLNAVPNNARNVNVDAKPRDQSPAA